MTRVAIAYAAAAWVLLQASGVVTPILGLPDWVPKLVFVLLVAGFIPTLVFAWAYEITPSGLKKEKDVDPAESITRITGRKLDFIIIGVLALAVMLLLADRVSGPAASVPDQPSERSIAVLPFDNMSADEEQEYFSDGITEEILNSLASVEGLKVAGRTSSFAYKDKNEDLRRIGKVLGVAHILEGSVRKSGNRIRITAQLVNVEDGFHVWSDTYDRELTDVFAIQDEIANEILRQLQARLLGEERSNLASQPADPAAYDLYLLARQRIYDRTRASLESAVDLLDKAIAKDPDYAPAYAQRGIATLLLSDRSYGTIPREEAQRQGKRFVDMALELDPKLAEAWAGLGLYYYDIPGEHDLAIETLTKALSLNPNLLDAGNWLLISLETSGDYRSAIRLLDDFTERDPLFPPVFTNGVFVFSQFGKIARAEALIEQYRAYDPDSAILYQAEAMNYLVQGHTAEGLRLGERAVRLAPSDQIAREAYSIGLRSTHQWQRLADEGLDDMKVDALERLGRETEALELASRLAVEGDPFPLFVLYNRTDRSRELVSYLEERWPTLAQFAAQHPHNPFGYGLMMEVAVAYSRAGNEERFEEALALVEAALQDLAEAGADNFVNLTERARYHALSGNFDTAIRDLEAAAARGSTLGHPVVREMPMFEPWHDHPRLLAAEARIAQNINEERRALGLPRLDGRLSAGRQ